MEGAMQWGGCRLALLVGGAMRQADKCDAGVPPMLVLLVRVLMLAGMPDEIGRRLPGYCLAAACLLNALHCCRRRAVGR